MGQNIQKLHVSAARCHLQCAETCRHFYICYVYCTTECIIWDKNNFFVETCTVCVTKCCCNKLKVCGLGFCNSEADGTCLCVDYSVIQSLRTSAALILGLAL